jgi:hypothetical protein
VKFQNHLELSAAAGSTDMSSPTPDRKALEELWGQRLEDAKLQLDFARNYLAEVERDYSAGSVPINELQFAHHKALRVENLALRHYNHVRRIYTDLMVNGVIPDESEWHKAQAADASGSGTQS